jgi:hypothetical protein
VSTGVPLRRPVVAAIVLVAVLFAPGRETSRSISGEAGRVRVLPAPGDETSVGEAARPAGSERRTPSHPDPRWLLAGLLASAVALVVAFACATGARSHRPPRAAWFETLHPRPPPVGSVA